MARVVLSEQTADKIQQLIDRQYRPGDRIPSEMELAEFLSVSRTTIREAVKILCSRNILEIRRGYGTFVCENPGIPQDPFGSKYMDEDQLKNDIFEISELIEPELIRLAARKASGEDIARMKKVHKEMEELLSRYRDGEYVPTKEFRKLDVEFHKAVIEGCRNQIISSSLPLFISICAEWYNVWTNLDFNEALENFEIYHPKILEAVEAHDAETAYQHAKEHTRKIIEIYLKRRGGVQEPGGAENKSRAENKNK